jgi:hypothetical protein
MWKSGIFGRLGTLATEEIFVTVAEVDFFTAATEFLPALRRLAQETNENIAPRARSAIARVMGFIGGSGERKIACAGRLSTPRFVAFLIHAAAQGVGGGIFMEFEFRPSLPSPGNFDRSLRS